jgi:hypothetical protein
MYLVNAIMFYKVCVFEYEREFENFVWSLFICILTVVTCIEVKSGNMVVLKRRTREA